MSERYERGMEIRRRLVPDGHSDALDELAEFAPDFARLTVEVPFGEIYARPGLDLKERELVTLAAIGALGAEAQFRVHVRYALNAGLTPAQIIEVAMQVAVYAGWPRGAQAIRAAKEAIEEAR